MKKALFLLLTLTLTLCAAAQVQSPDQFLGYKLGSRFTPHFKVVNYFRYVARAAGSVMKLEDYGVTNEGRPLLLAYIANSENLEKLDAIRTNNLRLAGMSSGAPDLHAPAVVWLSYNVHGNETSSSEAAMLTLFTLVSGSDARVKDWLKNTVVIMDPCINPDGRDRYVNWYNSVTGMQPDPLFFSREHMEPWPGGRSNHYYFDLNRDWAWQTQVETRQRLVKYSQWLPQVHVDFHEQGYNSPYYFAPAAEPYHDVITPWQREFQNIIGKNNAKYFDEHGWLFFTRERFDLFYPSYGDTYPIYRGAIGMTFEQGGHGRAGRAVINEAGDTLTLWDRLYHHYTTGLSAIEMASLHADRLLQEFKKYYDKAKTSPAGEFKAYIVKGDEGDRISRLKLLLERNNISWLPAPAAVYSGLNFFSGKTEPVRTDERDLVINMNQPNSNLLRVLFERNARLTDSVTYDITAWSVPFAYGLVTYGVNNFINGNDQRSRTEHVRGAGEYVGEDRKHVGSTGSPVGAASEHGNAGGEQVGEAGKHPGSTAEQQGGIIVAAPRGENAAAWLVRWNGLGSVKLLTGLLQKGVKIRYAEQPFAVEKKNFEKGTLIIARTSNVKFGDSLAATIEREAEAAGVAALAIHSTLMDKGYDFGSEQVHVITRPSVGLLAGPGVSSLGMGEVWQLFEQQIGYPVHVINADDLDKSILGQLNVLIMPNGLYRFLNEKVNNDMLKEWVSGGGRLIALEGAVAQLARNDWGIKLKGTGDKKDDKKEEVRDDYGWLRRFEKREREAVSGSNPGSIYKVELDNSHPLAFGYPDYYYTLKQDDDIYDFLHESGWNVGVVKRTNYVTGFAGSRVRERLRDGLLFGVQEIGKGTVVYLAEDPLFRSFWENGKLLFCNAVFIVQ